MKVQFTGIGQQTASRNKIKLIVVERSVLSMFSYAARGFKATAYLA